MTRLGELPEGVPRVFAVIEAREDAWVTYPPEPVGSAWLVRQPKGAAVPVARVHGRVPPPGVSGSLAEGGRVDCPCHQSRFDLQGRPLNAVPPRMDRLDVQLSDDADPVVLVGSNDFIRTIL